MEVWLKYKGIDKRHEDSWTFDNWTFELLTTKPFRQTELFWQWTQGNVDLRIFDNWTLDDHDFDKWTLGHDFLASEFWMTDTLYIFQYRSSIVQLPVVHFSEEFGC